MATKRKLPKVGIFDPNLSQDPQYGNVSTLPDGRKRIHFHMTAKPNKADDYLRFTVIIPECNIPTISADEISKVEKITLPIIKNFKAVMGEPGSLENKSVSAMIVGIFECDKFDEGPYPTMTGEPGTKKVPYKDVLEPLFILNKPIAYSYFETDDHQDVSNLAERGYILLQNYVNIFVGMKNMNKNNHFTFNCYIDYVTCETTYKEALIWKADFEQLIQNRLKYRAAISPDNATVVLCSRGKTLAADSSDPAGFQDIVNTSEIYKVPERSIEEASLSQKELIWAKTIKEIYKS